MSLRTPRRATPAVLPIVLLATLLALPLAHAHGAAEARELEVELLADEETDASYATGGYDITTVFLGEAHDPAVGTGGAGDGFYFRLDLYGNPSLAPATDAWRVEFTIGTPAGPITRTLSTRDGATFETDLSRLVATQEESTLVVERAFIAFTSAGLSPGDSVGDIVVRSYVGGDLRDQAPGALYVPGSGGAIELPVGESRVVTPTYTLEGAGQYATATARTNPDGEVVVNVTSLLQEGSQHVSLAIPETLPAGWTIEPIGATAASLGPRGAVEFRIRAEGRPDALLVLDVTTDVGGRTSVEINRATGAIQTIGRSVPTLAPALQVAAVALLALAASGRRRE